MPVGLRERGETLKPCDLITKDKIEEKDRVEGILIPLPAERTSR
jgi:hypothetical protein